MYVFRDVFQCKPGKAKKLVAIFKRASSEVESLEGFSNFRIMTDFAAPYWTVAMEVDVEKLDSYGDMAKSFTSRPEVAELFKNYMDLLDGGRREIYRIE